MEEWAGGLKVEYVPRGSTISLSYTGFFTEIETYAHSEKVF
jgi:hypothetical protein